MKNVLQSDVRNRHLKPNVIFADAYLSQNLSSLDLFWKKKR